jgi:hypothetical protein
MKIIFAVAIVCNGLRDASRPIGLALFALLFAWNTGPAQAEASMSSMLSLYDHGSPAVREEVETLFAATENGMAWANSELTQVRKTKPVYCAPSKLALTGSQLIDIARRETEDFQKLGGQAWGLALLVSLQRTFPCPP